MIGQKTRTEGRVFGLILKKEVSDLRSRTRCTVTRNTDTHILVILVELEEEPAKTLLLPGMIAIRRSLFNSLVYNNIITTLFFQHRQQHQK